MYKTQKTQPPFICWGWEIYNKKGIYKQSTLLFGMVFAVKLPPAQGPSYLHLNYHCPKLFFQGCVKHFTYLVSTYTTTPLAWH